MFIPRQLLRKSILLIGMVLLLALSAGIVSAQADGTPQSSQSEDTYVVRPGDTLGIIAQRYNTSVQAIVARNNITNPSRIYAGQVLVIPRSVSHTRTYTVRPGDSLTKIARRFNTTVDALVNANNITRASTIFPGEVLRIPSTASPVTPAPAPGRSINHGRYTVQPGDTLFEIARSFNRDIYNIARANGLLNLNLIFSGQSLRIPGY